MNDQDYDHFKSANEQAVASSNAVLRSLILINGGAAVAILAFIGSIFGRESVNITENVSAVTKPLLWFGWGVAIAVISMIFAYFTHYFTAWHSQATPPAHIWPGRFKVIFHLFAISSALVSLAFFVCGMYQVSSSVAGLR
jgi:hypothetical protein